MTHQDKTQGEGRPEGAAPQAYPPANKHDAIERAAKAGDERRSFEASKTPAPPRSARDSDIPTAVNEGRIGPGADPVEGKR
jgi:hypothetical protein